MIGTQEQLEKFFEAHPTVVQDVYNTMLKAPYSSCSMDVIMEYIETDYKEEDVKAGLDTLLKNDLAGEYMGGRYKSRRIRPAISPEDYDKCRHGYILPNGAFYNCGYAAHNNLAVDLQDQGIIPKKVDCYDYPDANGWLKLTAAMMSDCEFMFNFTNETGHGDSKVKTEHTVTKEQIEFIKAYKLAHKETELNFQFSWYKVEDIDKLFNEDGSDSDWSHKNGKYKKEDL